METPNDPPKHTQPNTQRQGEMFKNIFSKKQQRLKTQLKTPQLSKQQKKTNHQQCKKQE